MKGGQAGGWRGHPAGGMCGVAILQLSQKKAIGCTGTAPIQPLTHELIGRMGAFKTPNSPHVHTGISFLFQKAAFATRNRLSGWIRSLARALSAS